MKKLITLFIISTLTQFTIASTKQPNVIILLVDDQGYADLSCHGNPIFKTPALDKLANESIRFTDFHVSSMCTPSRSQLLTGRDACRNGAFAWAYSRETINLDEQLLPEVFKANGYATGHFGKWHLNDNYPNRPMDRGFDESIKFGGASISQSPDYWNNDYVDDFYEHNGVIKQYKGFANDIWFEKAKEFMMENKKENKPFFVYLPSSSAHEPLIIDSKYYHKYLDLLNNGYKIAKGFENEKINTLSIAKFYAILENFDNNVASLDGFLKENGLFENTIVIYLTDNGGTYGVYVDNSGMRGKKCELTDGGHRVPFFIRYPEGDFAKPKSISCLTHVQDIMPTLLDLCNLKHSEIEFDGVTLTELLKGQKEELSERILVMQNATAPLPTKYKATVMMDKWRLIGKDQLYNIENDSFQSENLIRKYPEIVEKMLKHYEKWWVSVQPSISKVPSIQIGSKECEEVTLTCFDWVEKFGAGNNTIQTAIRAGANMTGYFNIEILEDGLYEFKFSRYATEANTKMSGSSEAHQTLTVLYRKGRSLPIAYTKIQLSGMETDIIPVADSDYYTLKNINLKKGKYTLRTDFLDKDKKQLCGAYYTYVKKLDTDSNNY